LPTKARFNRSIDGIADGRIAITFLAVGEINGNNSIIDV